VSETRIITELARKHRRVTQLGTQIHAGNNYRRVVELIKTGAIGTVREVHVWVSAAYGGKELPKETPPVPAGLHYDLWLGPVEDRPLRTSSARNSTAGDFDLVPRRQISLAFVQGAIRAMERRRALRRRKRKGTGQLWEQRAAARERLRRFRAPETVPQKFHWT